MQLVITTYGAVLKVKEGCFLVRVPKTGAKHDPQEARADAAIPTETATYEAAAAEVSDAPREDLQQSAQTTPSPATERQWKQFEISPKKVQSIVIGTAATLTTDALKLANEHNIDVVLLDQFGEPYGRVWHCRFGSTAAIRRRQIEVAETEQGLALATGWIGEKVGRQHEFLQTLLNARPEKKQEFMPVLDTLRGIERDIRMLKGTLDEWRNKILSLEAHSGKTYFEALAGLIPTRWKFEGRSRMPAKDYFNCFLNYAYGVLYSRVERACVLAGLDPFVGFLHTDGYGKKSLVFDMIEPFRHLADSTVFYLFSGRQVKQEHAENVPNGLTLNQEGKKLLMEKLAETFDKTVRYRGRNIKQGEIIQYECHRLANSLLGKGESDFEMEVKEI